MQEGLIFNVIYKIWYDASPVNRSARVCLNRGDVNSANKLQSTRLHFVLQFFLIPRVFNTISEIRDYLFGKFLFV